MQRVWRELEGRTWRAYGSGHINDTYVTDDGRHLLQKINRAVFENSEGVVRNLQKVVAHAGSRYLMAPIETINGQAWHVDADHQVWRLFPFAANTRSLDKLDRDLLFEAARAFGRFVHDVSDFNEALETAIDGFHDLARYRQAFDAAAEQPVGTAVDKRADRDAIRQEIRFAEAYRPVDFDHADRVIHGDCKVNNLLFDALADRVAYVVDLDTVMRGHLAWDFGDLVRSAAGGAQETGAEIDFDAGCFREVARGYKHGLEEPIDADAFAAAPSHMSFMLGVRFLTDHLLGDRYFKVAQAGQNLARARAQFRLARRFDEMRGEMRKILNAV